MNAHRYDLMYHVEDSHWWYRGMEAITRAVIERAISNRRGLRILDAGCGTGAVMNYLADYGTVTGCDHSAEALHYSALRRHARLCRASVAALPFADASFDTAVCTFGLCAIPNIDTALDEMTRVLRPGGKLILVDHVASSSRIARGIQRAIEVITVPMASEHFLRRPLTKVKQLPFEIERAERFKLGLVERIVARKLEH